MISGIDAHRVPRPTKINMEHNTSENIAITRDSEGVNPNIAGNCISPPARIICNLGSPWVSIKNATPILVSNKTISTCDFLKFVFNIEFFIYILFMEVNVKPPRLDIL